MGSVKKQYYFATWLRAAGVIFILLCHFTAQSQNTYVQMSAQFFNIGVPIFFMLSGFLFGVRGGVQPDWKEWYQCRFRRIYIPYELFVVCLAVIFLVLGHSVLTWDWLWLVLGLQGSVVGVEGAEQTWFITSLLMCYLLTPVMYKLAIWANQKKIRFILTAFVAILIPLCLAVIPAAFVHTLFSPIFYSYFLAYLLGTRFDTIKFSKLRTAVAFFGICFSFAARIAARIWFDDTLFYDRIVSGYTHLIAAFCLFYLFAYLFAHKTPLKVICFISNISFEIYLYHYIFCVGPVSLFGTTPYWVIDCLLITVIVIVIAYAANRLTRFITRKLGG